MREVQKRQLQFGQVPVDKVWLDPKSRDDIPAVLKGLQHLYKEKTGGAVHASGEAHSSRGPTAGWGVRGWRCGGF